MSELSRFLIRHAAVGMLCGVLFVALLLGLDIGGLGTLMQRSDRGVFAAILLTVAMALTFASAQMGFAIMLRRRDDDKDSPP